MVSWRAREAAKQLRRREQNEATARARRTACSGGGERSFRCECGDAQCSCEITLTLSEYELMRGYATRFAVARNHENPESEHVIQESEAFTIVELVAGEAVKLARSSDPRQRRRERCWRRGASPGKPGAGQ